MRVQVEDRPRIESIRMSSTARNFATLRCLRFQRSRPASAASLLGELAITRSGIRTRGDFFRTADFFGLALSDSGAER